LGEVGVAARLRVPGRRAELLRRALPAVGVLASAGSSWLVAGRAGWASAPRRPVADPDRPAAGRYRWVPAARLEPRWPGRAGLWRWTTGPGRATARWARSPASRCSARRGPA